MKTIGLIGGLSWESSLEYYRIINEAVKDRLGEPHSCPSILYSVDFAEYEKLQHQGRWEALARNMVDIAVRLKRAGAELLVICSNTMHKMADDVEQGAGVPLVHIADATGEAVRSRGLSRVGLLGTRFTMEQGFLGERLRERYGIEVTVPGAEERGVVHDVIYRELISGVVREESRKAFIEIIGNLSGTEGIILGCTEIPMLIREGDVDLPVFDSTLLHARKAVELALAACERGT